MANDVMFSLFGLDPAESKRKREDEAAAKDLAFAQLTPQQQIIAMYGKAGRQFGEGINGAFGNVSPELKKERAKEDALRALQESGVDLSDPTVMYPRLAKELSARGLQSEATMVTLAGQNVMTSYSTKMSASEAKARGAEKVSANERIVRDLGEYEARVSAGGQLTPQEVAIVRYRFQDLSKDKIFGSGESQVKIDGLDMHANFPALGALIDKGGAVPAATPATTPATTLVAPQAAPTVPTSGIATPSEPPVVSTRTVQENLNKAGIPVTIDGILGPQTKAGVAKAAEMGIDVLQTFPLPQQESSEPQDLGTAPATPPTESVFRPGGMRATPTEAALDARRQAEEELNLRKDDAQRKDRKEVKELKQEKNTTNRLYASMNAGMDTFIKEAKALKAHPGLSSITGPIFGIAPSVSLTGDALGAKALLDRLTSLSFIKGITDLRQSSPTGGAVGNITEKEGQKLQESVSQLQTRQATADFKAALDKAIEEAEAGKKRLADAYKGDITALEGGDDLSSLSTPSAAPSATTPAGPRKEWNSKTKRWEYQ